MNVLHDFFLRDLDKEILCVWKILNEGFMSNCNSLWLTLYYTVRYHLHLKYAFSESAPLLSSMVFSVPLSALTSFPAWAGALLLFGPSQGPKRTKKGQKWEFSQIKPYVTTCLIERCGEKVKMALRTSRLNSFAHLLDQECPKNASKGGQKMAQISWK